MFLHLSVILFTGGVVCLCPPPRGADGYCSGRYASYWNAFLFVAILEDTLALSKSWFEGNLTLRTRNKSSGIFTQSGAGNEPGLEP